jgi:hypothetical protein
MSEDFYFLSFKVWFVVVLYCLYRSLSLYMSGASI